MTKNPQPDGTYTYTSKCGSLTVGNLTKQEFENLSRPLKPGVDTWFEEPKKPKGFRPFNPRRKY